MKKSNLLLAASTENVKGRRHWLLQAQLIGAAYEGQPTQEKALVFAFAGQEYLVPVVNNWNGVNVTESVVRLDLAERIVARPNGTSRIGDMRRSKVLSADAKAAILNGVQAWFLPEPGYRITIIPFTQERPAFLREAEGD